MKRLVATFLVAFVALFVFGTSAAQADAPLSDIPTSIIDNAGVLDDQEVQMAIQRVEDQTDYRLTVVFVDSFDGMSGAKWATTSAEQAGLNPDQDILFAVATEGHYGSAYPNGTPIARNITNIEDLAIADLKNKDWTASVSSYAGGVIKAANLPSALDAVATPSEPIDWSGFIKAIKIVGIVIVVGLVLFFIILLARELKARMAEASRQDELAEDKKMRVVIDSVDTDGLITQFEEAITYVDAEFPGLDIEDARATLADVRTKRAAIKEDSQMPKTKKVSAQTIIDESDIVLNKLDSINRFMKPYFATFADLRNKVENAKVTYADTAGKIESFEAALTKAQASVSEIQASFDEVVFAQAIKDLSAAQESVQAAKATLAQAGGFIAAGQKGRAVMLTDKAREYIKESNQTPWDISKLVDEVLSANEKAKKLGKDVDADISYLIAGPKRQGTKTDVLLDTAKMQRRRLTTTNFNTGNPLNELATFEASFKNFNKEVSRIRAQERQIAESIEALPNLMRSAHKAIQHASDYYKDHSSDIGSAAKRTIESIGSALSNVDGSTDPVSAVSEVKAHISKLESALSSMEREVKQKKDEEEAAARRARRRRQENSSSSLYGAGFGYAAGASTNYGGGGGGGGFGGSGGSFDGGGGSGGSF